VAAGLSNSFALRVDGSIVAWGAATGGALTLPAAATNVSALAAGNYHALALRRDGTVIAWGTNNFGQTLVPAGLSNVVAIAAGANHSLAVRSDGTAVAWGLGSSGQTNLPAGLSGLGIAGGDVHTVALGNVAPTANTLIASGYVNHDVTLTLTGADLNKDALGFRMLALPIQGTLYQYTPGNRGPAIGPGNPNVTDPLGRIIFAPAAGTLGTSYALFAANDGLADSPMTWLAITVGMPASPSTLRGSKASNGIYTVSFSGSSNATYSIWASTNLAAWDYLGPANPATTTLYQWQDFGATNWPQRYYRATVP
jgi:hypothetical protein